ncbi:methionine synthase reductase-like [Vanessa cardui]|uniref:methionine synthase reductase-like n=1 Tax=Vanessa cardui TaxID=171605 RepID=UPI001F1402F1|nr:methionine synthase reductase-like [Vanessa cardui]XP_046978250.1 methionine synthase reductase-like [Vanessa cardui]
MVVVQHFQELIDTLDKTKLFSIPKCKEQSMKIEYTSCNNENKTVYNGPDPVLPFAASEIFLANINKWRRLTKLDDNCKSVYEVSFNIEGSNFDFAAGDTIGIVPQNNKSEVDDIINHLELISVVDLNYTLRVASEQKGAKIPAYIPVTSTLRHVLTHCVDLRGIIKKLFLLALAQHTKDKCEKRLLEYLCSKEGSSEYTTHILNKRISVLDLFKLFKSCKPPIEVILEHLPRLLPRPYSIVNTRHSNPNILKICFSVMDIGDNRKGITTGWLEDIILQRCDIEEKMNNLNLYNKSVQVPIYIRKNVNEFCLPKNTETPLILIGPGTGVSPFIGFLEEREYVQKNDPDKKFGCVWLFFGCRNPKLDFIYEDELKSFTSKGVISKLITSFSRVENADFHYVQDAIIKNGEEVTKLIMEGAQVYVCGDIKNMATQVKDAIQQSIVKHGNLNEEEAENFMAIMQKEKRYLTDVWN